MTIEIREMYIYSPHLNKHFYLGVWLENGEPRRLTLRGKYTRNGYVFETTIPISIKECQEKLGIEPVKLEKILKKLLSSD